MKLFDSHCHLNDPSFEKDIGDVIARAKRAGVHSFMTVGASQTGSERAVSIARTIPGCFASVGIHPHRAKDCNEDMLSFLYDLAGEPNVKAWGEIGLDFNRMYSPKNEQEHWFIRQIECADELNLPVIFHERDTNGRFLEILKTHPHSSRKGVIHCFSGDSSELKTYIELGYCIGITGIVTQTQRGATLRKQVPFIPLEHLVIETDAPYLTPTPEKNQTRRNEPAFVRSVFLKLSEIRGEDPETLSDALWENTCRLFNIVEEKL